MRWMKIARVGGPPDYTFEVPEEIPQILLQSRQCKCGRCGYKKDKSEFPSGQAMPCATCAQDIEQKKARRLAMVTSSGRICSVCEIKKPSVEFHRGSVSPDGLASICKVCHAAKWNPISKAKRATYRTANPLPPQMSKCLRCEGMKPYLEYPRRPGHKKLKRSRYCRECDALVQQERAARVGRILNEPKSHRRRKGLVAILSDGTLSAGRERELIARAKGCPYCGVTMTAEDKTLDHMNPISKGGMHGLSNVVVCCRSCNARKCDKDFPEWLDELTEDFRRRMAALYRKCAGAHVDQRPLLLMFGTERLQKSA